MRKAVLSLKDFAHLISPDAKTCLQAMGLRSHCITRQRFGNTIGLFAPLYLSNECINICAYCGFSRNNAIVRVTLTLDEVIREAQALLDQGFRNILLVAGEHPKFVSKSYLVECVRALHRFTPAISLEVGPMDEDDYRAIVQAGAEGLVAYQETYDRDTYMAMHTAGPKRDFEWRMETPERAYAAGFRRLGIGALFGLNDRRFEALCVAVHADYLLRKCWKAQLTISLPRLRPCAGEFQPHYPMSDQDLVQLVCAFRLLFPDVGLVLSTREPQHLRDALVPLGITLMSAGSHTAPGGYTKAGVANLHYTEGGRHVRLTAHNSGQPGQAKIATEQFKIADTRSPAEVADLIRRLGYDPVWKDWDASLACS
jgi:2-iminoacetate synthase